ncbi:MAG: class I SAM-dependent methyltransferase [Albidovulum sp.]
MTTAPQPRPCPACDASDASRIAAYSRGEWDVVACDPCGFVYLQNPVTYEALKEDFAWEKAYAASKVEKRGSSPLSGLNRRIRKALGHRSGRRGEKVWTRAFGQGRILDIGCGDYLRPSKPMIPYGVELSSELHARVDPLMRARGGYCLHAPGAEGIWQFDAGFFDGIIMSSYLEHETEMRRVLEGAFRAPKPGGAVFIRVPNYASLNRRVMGPKWCGFRYPDHVNYFTLASLTRVAGLSGFLTKLVNRTTLWVDDNIQVLLIKPQHS